MATIHTATTIRIKMTSSGRKPYVSTRTRPVSSETRNVCYIKFKITHRFQKSFTLTQYCTMYVIFNKIVYNRWTSSKQPFNHISKNNLRISIKRIKKRRAIRLHKYTAVLICREFSCSQLFFLFLLHNNNIYCRIVLIIFFFSLLLFVESINTVKYRVQSLCHLLWYHN